jgi:hypothetical protein
MRVKSRRIYTALNGGCYLTQPGDNGTVAEGKRRCSLFKSLDGY